MSITCGSLFSGIGGFDLGFQQAGIETVWQVEINERCRAVLERHYPNVERHNDVREVGKHNLAAVDLICGGFPCQDLSIAGRRAGLAGERSGLWYEFHRVIAELKPRWVVIENVPGLLSSAGGQDFAVILRGLVECGYGVSWRVLDAQYFGVAQRRRRVFIVGSLGDGRSAEVLFEREGLPGNTPPSRKEGEKLAYPIRANPSHSGEKGDGGINTNLINSYTPGSYADYVEGIGTLRANGGDYGGGTEMLIAKSLCAKQGVGRNDPNSETFVTFQQNQRNEVRDLNDLAGALPSQPGMKQQNYLAFNIQHNDGGDHKRKDRPNGGMYVNETDTALTVGSTDLTAVCWQNKQQSGEIRVQEDNLPTMTRYWGTGGNNVAMVGVRRLTPTECERLQGFPDGWTEGQSDSTRYRQLGNAVCVPVIRWIGSRIVLANT